LSRTEEDTIYKDTPVCLHGIPVMVKVPTHLDVAILEATYWRHDTTKNDLIEVPQDIVHREVAADLQQTEKMFIVDPLRPGAGLQNYGFTFKSSGQGAKAEYQGAGYLKNTTYMADDQTITTGASLLATIVPILARPTANETTPKPATVFDDLVKCNRMIAFRRFDLASPGFEIEVTAFVELYLNNCHKCNYTVPPLRGTGPAMKVEVPASAPAAKKGPMPPPPMVDPSAAVPVQPIIGNLPPTEPFDSVDVNLSLPNEPILITNRPEGIP
jgi:hypothetical protein